MRWVLALAMLVPCVAGGVWSQPGGDAGHAGLVDVHEFDVQGSLRLTEPGFVLDTNGYLPAFVAPTQHGIAALGRQPIHDQFQQNQAPQATCQVFLTAAAPGALPARVGDAFACDASGRLLGYDAERDLLFAHVAQGEGTGLMRAISLADGTERYALEPDVALPNPSAADNSEWTLSVPALAADRIYLAMATETGTANRVAAFDLDDGRLVWSVSLENPAVVSLVGTYGLPGLLAPFHSGGFTPLKATASSAGIVVSGRCVTGNGGAVDEDCLVWLDAVDGATVGWVMIAPPPTGQAYGVASSAPSSQHSAANGPFVAAIHNDHFVRIHAGRPQGEILALGELAQPLGEYPGAAWTDHALALPLVTRVIFVDDRDPSALTTWEGFQGEYIQQVAWAPQGLVVVAAPYARDTLAADLLLVDPATRSAVARTPLPMRASTEVPGGTSLYFVDAGDGRLLVFDQEFDAVLVGPAAVAALRVAVADAHAPAGEPVTVEWDPVPATRYLVAWGDGGFTEGEPGQGTASNRYLQAGTYTVRVTAVHEDGRTATTLVDVHPGMPRSPGLNFFQKAFSPERQEWTFFILGLAVTTTGASGALLARRRSHSRVHAELAILDQIADQGRRDPVEARRDLDDYQRRLRERLARGELRETQYDILDRRARDVRHQLDAR